MKYGMELSGLKMTKQREKIIDILYQKAEPLTAEEIFINAKEDYPKIALTTVYRNLDALTENELVNKTMYGDGTARYELISNEHVHRHMLICMECNTAVPLEHCPIHEIESGLKEKTGFQVTGHNLEIYGYCKDCGNKKNDKK